MRLSYTLRRCQYDDWQPKAAERMRAVASDTKQAQAVSQAVTMMTVMILTTGAVGKQRKEKNQAWTGRKGSCLDYFMLRDVF